MNRSYIVELVEAYEENYIKFVSGLYIMAGFSVKGARRQVIEPRDG